MSSANGGAGGQAPASDPQSGQAPQANNGGTPQAPAPQGQAPEGNTASPSGQQHFTPAQYEAMIADLRREAASHRTEKTAAQAELKKIQDASLTAEQKRERDFAEMQTRDIERELTLQQLYLERDGYRLAPTLGIADIGAALALVQSEHRHDLTFDEKTGQPKNLDKLLEQVVNDHPILVAQPQGQQQPGQPGYQRPPVTSGSPMSPSRGNAQPAQPARTPGQLRRLDQVEWSS